MKIESATIAVEILKRNGVDPRMYSVGPPTSTECTVLENRQGIWITYYWERGQETFLQNYADEYTAVQAFLDKVVNVASLTERRQIVLK